MLSQKKRRKKGREFTVKVAKDVLEFVATLPPEHKEQFYKALERIRKNPKCGKLLKKKGKKEFRAYELELEPEKNMMYI